MKKQNLRAAAEEKAEKNKKMQDKILETPRLILEKLTEKHKENLFKLLSNERVHRHFPKALNKEESEEFFNKVQKKYEEDGFSFWAVIRKEDSQFLGICGILKQIVEGKEAFEVGYRILDNFWGKSYGTEAANGCIIYGKEELRKDNIIALIREQNFQSIRVAEKNGMKYEKDVIAHDLQHRLYRILF